MKFHRGGKFGVVTEKFGHRAVAVLPGDLPTFEKVDARRRLGGKRVKN